LALTLLGLVPIQFCGNFDRSDAGSDYSSDNMAHWQIDDVPPRALLLPAYFQTSFRLAALDVVDRVRPDVDVLDRSLLTYPGAFEQATSRYPELSPLIAAPLRAGAPTPVQTLRTFALHRPVLLELHPNLDDAPDSYLLPMGAFAQLLPESPSSDRRTAAEERDSARAEELASLLTSTSNGSAEKAYRQPSELALLWHDFVRMRFYCKIARLAAAHKAYEAAHQLFPDDAMLDADAIRCGLLVP
jgi:hypothetical protein